MNLGNSEQGEQTHRERFTDERQISTLANELARKCDLAVFQLGAMTREAPSQAERAPKSVPLGLTISAT